MVVFAKPGQVETVVSAKVISSGPVGGGGEERRKRARSTQEKGSGKTSTSS